MSEPLAISFKVIMDALLRIEAILDSVDWDLRK